MGQSLIDNLIAFIFEGQRSHIKIPKGSTEIKPFAYLKWNTLKTVDIPYGVTTIGSSAFQDCRNLKHITLPNSLQKINVEAFKDCRSLESIDIPNSVEYLGAQTFENCHNLKNIHLPHYITSLPMGIFWNCNNLTSINLPANIREINYLAFEGSGLESIVLPAKTTKICEAAFYNCTHLRQVTLPKNLKQIETSAFQHCPIEEINFPFGLKTIGNSAFSYNHLVTLILPSTIKYIGESAFSFSKKLEKVILPEGLKSVSKRMFAESHILTHVELPSTIITIEASAFNSCTSLSKINIPHNLHTIDFNAFNHCSSLKTLHLPKSVKKIWGSAFAFCENLDEVSLYTLDTCGIDIFRDIKFKYLYRNPTTEQLIYTKELLEQLPNTPKLEIYPLSTFSSSISSFDCGQLALKGNIEKYSKIARKLSKSNFMVSKNYLDMLGANNMLHKFESMEFKYLAKELPNFKIIFARLNAEEQLDMLKFATVIGCFSKEKIKDNNGKETKATVGQKASTLFANIATDPDYIAFFHEHFDSLDITTPFNQNLLEFLSQKGNRGQYYNIHMLLRLDSEYENIFANTINHWSEIENYRNTVNDTNGLPVTLTWEDAITKYHLHKNYNRVNEENIDMAIVFGSKGISQQFLDSATAIRKQARQNNMRANILSTPLKEESILDQIERIKNTTAEILADSKKQLDTLYSRNFTYEMLDKYDPRNAIIGVYCSCCGTITSTFYGKDIAKATMTADNVQNLIIRNNRNEIIAKGTMYVNENLGYAVINDFELNKAYRNHEQTPGIYTVDDGHKEELIRDEIFKTFMRGINAFVEQYDAEHPNNPIKQVNVGWGYNRLKRQCDRYKKASRKLEVPIEYSFIDAREEQRILYSRKSSKLAKDNIEMQI